VYPKPVVSPTLRNQSSRGIVRPHQGEKRQVADHMGQNGWKRRVGEICSHAKRHARKKVHQKFWPQEAMLKVGESKN
jgi:hypothetical protein